MPQRGFGSSSSRFIGNNPPIKSNTNEGQQRQPSQQTESRSRSNLRNTNKYNDNLRNERSQSRSRSYSYDDNDDYNSDSSYTNQNQYNHNTANIRTNSNRSSVNSTSTIHNTKHSTTNNHNNVIQGGIRSISRNRSSSQSSYDDNNHNISSKGRSSTTVQTSKQSSLSSSSSSVNKQSTGLQSTSKPKSSSVTINKEDKLWGDIAALTSKLTRIQRGDNNTTSTQHQTTNTNQQNLSTINTLIKELTGLQNNRNVKPSIDTLNIIAKAATALSLHNNSTSSSLSSSHSNNHNNNNRLSLSQLQNTIPSLNSSSISNFEEDDDDDISDASEEEGAGEAGMAAAVAELTKAEVARQLAAVGLGSSNLSQSQYNNNNTFLNTSNIFSDQRLPSTSMFVHPPTTAIPYPITLPNNLSNSVYTLFSNQSTMNNNTINNTPRPILIQPNNNTIPNNHNNIPTSPTRIGATIQADFSMNESITTDISSEFDENDSDDNNENITTVTNSSQNTLNAQQRLLQMTLNGGKPILANTAVAPSSPSSSSMGPVKRRNIQSPSSPLSPVSSNNPSRSPGRKSVTFADEHFPTSTNNNELLSSSTVVPIIQSSQSSNTNITIPTAVPIQANPGSNSSTNTNSLPPVIVVTQPSTTPNSIYPVLSTTTTSNVPDPLVTSLKTEVETMRNLLQGLMTEVVTQKVILQQQKVEMKSKSPRTPTNNNNSTTNNNTGMEDSTMLKSLATLLSKLIKQEDINNNTTGNTTVSNDVPQTGNNKPTVSRTVTPNSAKSISNLPSSSSSSSSTTKSQRGISPHPLELASPQLEQNSPQSIQSHRSIKASPSNNNNTNTTNKSTTILKTSQAPKGNSRAGTRKTVSYHEDVAGSSSASASETETPHTTATQPSIIQERRSLHPRNVKGKVGIAICDFEGDIAENQMSLIENERILITHEFETGWWYGYRLLSVPSNINIEESPGYARTAGYIPASFIEMTEEIYDSDDIVHEEEPTNQKRKLLSTPYPSNRSHHLDDEDDDNDETNDNTIQLSTLKSSRSGRLTAHKAAAARARLSLSFGGNNSNSNLDLSQVMLASPPNNTNNNSKYTSYGRSQSGYTAPTPSVIQPSNRKPNTFTSPSYHDQEDVFTTRDLISSSNYTASKRSSEYPTSTTNITSTIKAGKNDWNTLKEAYNQLRTKAVAMEASFNSAWTTSNTTGNLRSPLSSTFSTASSFPHTNYTTLPVRPHTSTASTISLFPVDNNKPSITSTSFSNRAHSLATPARTPYYTTSKIAPGTIRSSMSVGPTLNGTIASLFFPPKLTHKDMATSPMATNEVDNNPELSPMKTEPRPSVSIIHENSTKDSIPAPPTSPVPLIPVMRHSNSTNSRTPYKAVTYQDENIGTDDNLDSPIPPPPSQSPPPISPRLVAGLPPDNRKSNSNNVREIPEVTMINITDDEDDDDDDEVPPPPPPLPSTSSYTETKQTTRVIAPSLQPHPPNYPRGNKVQETNSNNGYQLPVNNSLSATISDTASKPQTINNDNNNINRPRQAVPVRTIAIESPSPPKQSPIQPRTVHTSPPPLNFTQSTSNFAPVPSNQIMAPASFVPSTNTQAPMVSALTTSAVLPTNVPSISTSIPSSSIPNTNTSTASSRPLLRPYSNNANNTTNLAMPRPQETPNMGLSTNGSSSTTSSNTSSLNLPMPSSVPVNTNSSGIVKPFLSMNSNPAPGIAGPGSKQPKPMVGRTAINTAVNNGTDNNNQISPPSPPLGSMNTTSNGAMSTSTGVLPPPPAVSAYNSSTNITFPTIPANTFSPPPPPPPPPSIPTVTATIDNRTVIASPEQIPSIPLTHSILTGSPLLSTTLLSSPLRIGGPLPNSSIHTNSLGARNRYSPDNNTVRKLSGSSPPPPYSSSTTVYHSPTYIQGQAVLSTSPNISTNRTISSVPVDTAKNNSSVSSRPPPPPVRVDSRLTSSSNSIPAHLRTTSTQNSINNSGNAPTRIV